MWFVFEKVAILKGAGFAFVAVSLIIAFGSLQAIENLGVEQLLEIARGLGIV